MKQKMEMLNYMYFLMWILTLSFFTTNPARADVTANQNHVNLTIEKISHTYITQRYLSAQRQAANVHLIFLPKHG